MDGIASFSGTGMDDGLASCYPGLQLAVYVFVYFIVLWTLSNKTAVQIPETMCLTHHDAPICITESARFPDMSLAPLTRGLDACDAMRWCHANNFFYIIYIYSNPIPYMLCGESTTLSVMLKRYIIWCVGKRVHPGRRINLRF